MAIKVEIGKSRFFMSPARELAKLVYDENDVSELKKYLDLYEASPESFILAIDTLTHRLVGYIISLPLDHKYFEKTTQKDYMEEDLSADKVRPYQEGNNFVYLFSIVSDLKHPQRLTILKELSKAYVEQLRKLAKDGKYVIRASAVALTPAGKKLCIGMDMEEVGVNPKGTVFVNEKFHKVFINTKTKNSVIKNFILKKKKRKAEEEIQVSA